jgi:hypothetical protein
MLDFIRRSQQPARHHIFRVESYVQYEPFVHPGPECVLLQQPPEFLVQFAMI